jgi:hypothetical protein
MATSQRLRGLELLRSIGAPVPNWQIIASPRDIHSLDDRGAKFGWTIRTCRRDGKREMSLFYLNLADSRKAVQILRERLAKAGRDYFYIIYPSWNFRFSCNIVLRDKTYCIEGKYGSQKDLAVGRSGPDFGMLIPFGMRTEMTCYSGKLNEEVLTWLGRILWWCRRIPLESFYTEVALVHTSALMFYDLFEI